MNSSCLQMCKLFWLRCLPSFSSSSHSTGKVEAHLHTCFRDTRKALLGKGSSITSQLFLDPKWNKHWSEVKHGYLKRNILLFLVGKVCKRRVQQNTHTQSHRGLRNKRCLSRLSWYSRSHGDTHDSPADFTFKGLRIMMAAWILYHTTTITVLWLTEFFSQTRLKCYRFRYFLPPYCFFCIWLPECFFLVCITGFDFRTGFLMPFCTRIMRFSKVYSIISVSVPLHYINTMCLQNLTLGLASCLLDNAILYYFFYQYI